MLYYIIFALENLIGHGAWLVILKEFATIKACIGT